MCKHVRQRERGTVEFVETAIRLSEGEYYTVVHGYTTTARPLLSILPGLQGLGWAKYVLWDHLWQQ